MMEAPMMRTRVRQRGDEMSDEDKQTIRRIEGYMKNPPTGSRPFKITPVVAKYILVKYNLGNRSKKPGKIDEYAHDMLNNNWRRTMEAMKFSDQMLLRDGQNRLYACVKAGKPFEVEIGFGVPDDAFVKMDQGKNRSSGDVLQIAGFKDTNTLANAVRWSHLFATDRAKKREGLSPEETLALLQSQYADLPNFIAQAGRIYSLHKQPKGLVAALLYTFHQRDPALAKEWGDAWEQANHAGRYAPLDHAHKMLTKIRNDSMGRVHDLVRAAILVKAWNMFVAGSRGKQADVMWRPDEAFPSIFGPNTAKMPTARKRVRANAPLLEDAAEAA